MIAASRMRNGLGRWNWTHNDLGWLVSQSFYYCNLVILSLILLLKTIISKNTEKSPTKYFINPFSSMISLVEISQFTYSSKLHTAQKMKFSITDFFSKCDQIHPQFSTDLVTFTEEICNGKLHFLCSDNC